MAQYIDKAAVVAEIESLRCTCFTNFDEGVNATVQVLLEVLNTLEVKEVDLEKELIEWHKKHFKKDGTFIGMSGFYLTNNSQTDIARHFFELGLKAQKGE